MKRLTAMLLCLGLFICLASCEVRENRDLQMDGDKSDITFAGMEWGMTREELLEKLHQLTNDPVEESADSDGKELTIVWKPEQEIFGVKTSGIGFYLTDVSHWTDDTTKRLTGVTIAYERVDESKAALIRQRMVELYGEPETKSLTIDQDYRNTTHTIDTKDFEGNGSPEVVWEEIPEDAESPVWYSEKTIQTAFSANAFDDYERRILAQEYLEWKEPASWRKYAAVSPISNVTLNGSLGRYINEHASHGSSSMTDERLPALTVQYDGYTSCCGKVLRERLG